jgi:hypothetical protein
MCILRGKPFPKSLFDEFGLKPRHYIVFWSLYNDLCIGDEYWVYFTRQDLARNLKKHNPGFQLTNLSAVLQTLSDYDYIESRLLGDRSIGTGIQAYEIRIHPQAWTKVGPKKRPPEIQIRYNERRKARELAKSLSS